MKRISTYLFLLFVLFTANQVKADNYELYLVATEDESYTSLDIANLQSLSFVFANRASIMTVRYADNSTKSYNLAGYSAILFEDPVTVGIDDVAADAPTSSSFTFDGARLTAKSAGTLKLHRLDGREVRVQALSAGESISVDVPAGIYIVSLNGHSSKILVK